MSVLRDYAATLTQPDAGGGAAAAPPARHDEVLAPDGTLRPAWRALAGVATAWEQQDLRRVADEAAGLLLDDGVGPVPVPGRAGRRPWRLDPVPLVIDAASWAGLEVALAQRAELLDALLRDLHGEQRVLAEGLVPAAVVHAHSGYLRAVVRRDGLDLRPLVLSATDLGRDADGAWRVLADRTQVPRGLGHALENRSVLQRVQPALLREAPVHRVEAYVRALRSALQQSAEDDLADPRVVVLAPGPAAGPDFDTAHLAALLGFPLVQGSDLAVRDGWVVMRTSEGPERVDVVLRRVDAAWCDPLDLRGDSRLGVAGLTEAVRRRRVRVVNGLGTGVLENRGLLPFLPGVCRALLGEALRLPAVPTRWLGEPDALADTLDDLRRPDGAVRSGARRLASLDGPGEELADLAAHEVRARLEAAPHRYVVRDRLPLSQAPTWPGGVTGALLGAQPQPLVLRTFTLRYGGGYRPLAGGLASVLGDDRRPVATKDVWVLKNGPAEPDQGLAVVPSLSQVRTLTGPAPRQLDDLLAVGRQGERTEDLLRLVLVAHGLAELVGARPRSTDLACLEVVLDALAVLAPPVGGVPVDHRSPAAVEDELRSLLLDPERDGSVAAATAGLRAALQGVRDQLSGDAWRALGGTDRAVATLVAAPPGRELAESAGRMLTSVLALQGVVANMVRDPGWHLVGAGRCLERALLLVALLRSTTTVRRGLEVDRDVLSALLGATESAVTHRRRYRGHVRTPGVLDLLLTDPENPRSLTASLADLAGHLAAQPASTGSTRPERLLADLRADLATTDVATLVTLDGERRPHLAAFLAGQHRGLTRLAGAVSALHLSSGPAPRALGEFTAGGLG